MLGNVVNKSENECKFFVRMENQNREEYFNALVDKVHVKVHNESAAREFDFKPPPMDYKKGQGMRAGIFIR